jgi:glycosyltransferase involved in cell wall biosynthesis
MVTERPLSGRRIAILVQNLPVPFDRRVWQEALALRDAGAEVSVVCPGSRDFPAGSFVIEGINVRRFKMPSEASGALGYVQEYGVSLWRMSLELAKFRKNGRFDVVHFCNPPDLLALVALPQKLFSGAKLIFDQHDLGPELVVAKRMRFSSLFVAVARSWEKIAYGVADHVIATNESYKSTAVRRGRKAPDEVTVVRSGPRAEWIVPGSPTKKWSNGREFQVGYVGVIGKQEGIEYLLEAARILVQEEDMSVQFCLVGSGTEVESLINEAKRLGLEDYVSFLGRLSDEELRSVLSSSDVCVNPDEVNELNDKSTMNKILEYMALGKPIVQFDVTEGRFSAGQSSAYALPNDARSFAAELKRVLDDQELAANMGSFGRKRFHEELCWEQQVPKLVHAYQAALNDEVVGASA